MRSRSGSRKRKDVLTSTQRSYCMSRIRSKDTKIELTVRSALHKKGFRFRKHKTGLPGKPDIVFGKAKVIVFIDGEFWHGRNFKVLSTRLSPFWKQKIAGNIKRDQRNFRKLRRQGWRVIRIWENQVEASLDSVIKKIELAVTSGQPNPKNARSARRTAGTNASKPALKSNQTHVRGT